jgi:hypothetical protein
MMLTLHWNVPGNVNGSLRASLPRVTFNSDYLSHRDKNMPSRGVSTWPHKSSSKCSKTASGWLASWWTQRRSSKSESRVLQDLRQCSSTPDNLFF